jgi:hypothetical protein
MINKQRLISGFAISIVSLLGFLLSNSIWADALQSAFGVIRTAADRLADRAAAKRAFDAMMEMKKIDIAAIEAARRG